MLIDVTKLKTLYAHKKFELFNDELLKMKLSAIETSIRKYTNNNFQNRNVKGVFISRNGKLYRNAVVGLKQGDTVQICNSSINDGLYIIESVTDGVITLDEELYDKECNLLIKVEYPLDIIDGAVTLLEWDLFKSDKLGVASETISRHSVSYQTLDGTNTIDGRPAALYGFCKDYMRARI